TKVRWNTGNSCQTMSIGIGVRRPGWKCIKQENGTKTASRSRHRKRSQNNKGEDSWNHLLNWRNCTLIIKREWKKFCPDSSWKSFLSIQNKRMESLNTGWTRNVRTDS